ncbi:Trimethylguanosine synthase [Thalictrum thalictroides]|uniref:Trimethylguanosine synthase n=1 Tax=Thalictrum thalictroides TaxID=46969 RepID=A0A7J6WJS2_THATH|nr:Trimethylguanosine synthase [Thalictrum thalictroides]
MAVESENEAPAIKALGSLFKLTEVYLWDDDYVDNGFSANKKFQYSTNSASSKLDSTFIDDTHILEGMELTEQMNALGLPVSFNTSKKGSVMKKSKRKGTKVKPTFDHEDIIDGVVDVSKVGEVVSAINFLDKTSVSLCCIPTLSRSETSYSDIAEEVGKPHCSYNGESVSMDEICEVITGVVDNCGVDHDSVPCEVISNGNTDVAALPSNGDGDTSPQNALQGSFVDLQLDGHINLECSLLSYYGSESSKLCVDTKTEEPYIHDLSVSSQSPVMKDEYDNYKQCGEFGDWSTYWDAFYMRNYFYNVKTHETTWNPPPGVEYEAFSEGEPKCDLIVDTAKKDFMSELPTVEVLDPYDLRDTSQLLEEITSSNNSLGHSTHQSASGFEPDAGSVISHRDVSTIYRSHQRSDELEMLASLSEIGKNSDGEASLYTVSITQDDINSQLVSAEDWGNHLQKTPTNPETDGMNDYNSSNDQVLDVDRLTTTINKYSEENWKDIQLEYMAPLMDDFERQQDLVPSEKKKKKVRRTSTQTRLSEYNTELELEGLPQEVTDGIVKYWLQRYSLFSKFDDGIQMDKEGWFSVTPESIARHHAARCGGGIVIDSFTGVGGNAIQLAKRVSHVIAIDIDPQRIEYAQQNAAIYGVDGIIDFIKGDFFQLAPKMKADTVFLSPPWGGPDYAKVQSYSIKTMLKPHDGHFLFKTSRGIAPKIVMFLPRNVDLDQLAELSLSAHPPWKLEVEKNFLNGKLKAITAYFSDTLV